MMRRATGALRTTPPCVGSGVLGNALTARRVLDRARRPPAGPLPPRRPRWRLISIVAVALVGLAVLEADGLESAAYARLLEKHVRSATVAGIQLAAVDYRALRQDPDYPQALEDLARARLDARMEEADRIAFWINAYNLLALKAVLDRYPVRSIRDGGSFFRSIWKTPVGVVAGRSYSLDDIEHGILRKAFAEPRVHFAIVCASLSCPDLRREPYTGGQLDAQLSEAARRFLQNPTKGLVPGPDGRTARVSSIFKWFGRDFAAVGGVAAFVRANAGAPLAHRLEGLTEAGLSYLDYDWSLNDTAR